MSHCFSNNIFLVFFMICNFGIFVVIGQKPARIGEDGKPLLNRPIAKECKERISHLEWGGHHYFLSWLEPWHKFEDWDWFNGRNFCRDRCMDLISFDLPGEFELFVGIMLRDNISSIYTSGRKCNFRNKGCEQAHLQPINVNGWFWAGAGNARIPPSNEPSPETYWSHSGEEEGKKQPDNFEGLKEGPIDTEFDIGVTIDGLQEYHDEACLAVLNNNYNDGVAWHDVACHFRSVIVCEDSDQLMALVENKEDVDLSVTLTKNEKQVDIASLDVNQVAANLPDFVEQKKKTAATSSLNRPHVKPPPFGGSVSGFPPKNQPPRRKRKPGFFESLRKNIFKFIY